MSFLAKRFAAKGGAYFLQESKQTVSLLRHSPRILADKAYCVVTKAASPSIEGEPSPDVLPHASSTGNLNPLRADLSLPPVTFGLKRWEDSVSMDDGLRQDLYDEPVDPEAVAEGLAYVWKAFGIATVIVFGGASLIFGLLAAKLEIRSRDDIRMKGRDLIQQKLEMVREQVVPLNKQAENLSRRWRGLEVAEQSPIAKEVSKALGPRAS